MSELVEAVAIGLINGTIITTLSAGAYLGIKRYGDFLRRENEKNQTRYEEPRAGQAYRSSNKRSTHKVK